MENQLFYVFCLLVSGPIKLGSHTFCNLILLVTYIQKPWFLPFTSLVSFSNSRDMYKIELIFFLVAITVLVVFFFYLV